MEMQSIIRAWEWAKCAAKTWITVIKLNKKHEMPKALTCHEGFWFFILGLESGRLNRHSTAVAAVADDQVFCRAESGFFESSSTWWHGGTPQPPLSWAFSCFSLHLRRAAARFLQTWLSGRLATHVMALVGFEEGLLHDRSEDLADARRAGIRAKNLTLPSKVGLQQAESAAVQSCKSASHARTVHVGRLLGYDSRES